MRFKSVLLVTVFQCLSGGLMAAEMMTPTPQGTKPATSGCEALSAEEQMFVQQLKDVTNKAMFCTQFSAEQRMQAMQMRGKLNEAGKAMTADDAVQTVIQQGGGMQPMMPSSKSSGGGCPVH